MRHRPARAPRFHLDAELRSGTRILLSERAAHHALRVLRLRPGDEVVLFNGRGGEYQGVLASAGRRGLAAEVGAWHDVERESPLDATLVQGLSSGERMDLTIQKAVELGASAIRPVLTERSVVRLASERARNRLEHWRRIAVAACEQCGRNRLPTLHAPVALADYCAQPDDASLRLLLAPEATVALRDSVARIGRTVALAAGPESGFTAAEEANLAGAGFIPVRLGARVLRTETAALAALAALNALAGDF